MILYISLVLIFAIFTVFAAGRRVQTAGGGVLPYARNRKTDIKFAEGALVAAVLFILWFFTAFRSAEIGNDTQTYADYFYRINETGIDGSFRVEYGFQALCLLVGKFTDDAQGLFIVCATVCYAGAGIYIFRYSKNLTVSAVLLFCMFFSAFTNTLRQDIAMVVGLYAYREVKDKRYIISVLLIALATSFHRSAAVLVLLYFNRLLRFKFKTLIIVSAFIIILGISGLIGGLVEALASEYSAYFDGQYAHSGWLAVSVAVIRNAVFCWFIYKAYGKGEGQNAVASANFALLLWVCSLGFVVNLFTRAAEYFLLPAIVELPNAFAAEKIKNGKFWLAVTVIALLAYFLVTLILRPEWNNLYPFTFFWD